MAKKQIKDFTNKTAVETDDQILIQEAGGTTKKATQAELLKTTGDMTVYRGTAKEFEVGDELFETLSTGVYSFAGLSINAGDNTKFDCGLVDGHIVDFNAGTYDKVEYAGGTALSPALASGVTYILFNKAGTLVTQTTIPTDQDRRDNIYVGRVITISGIVVQTQDEPVSVLNPANKIYDLAKAIRIFNIDGNILSPNANLTFNKSAGHLFSIGANFTNNEKAPNRVDIPAGSPQTFAYITQALGSTEADTTNIDPTYYDNAGTKTLIPGAGQQATIQHVFLFPSGAVRIQYGETIYPKLTDAVQDTGRESFVINPNIPSNGVLIALICVRKDATDLSDENQARILLASRFGESSVGAGGQSVSSLQNAYANSVEPELVVDDKTGGAVTIKDSATNVNRDNIFEVTDKDDNVIFAVDKDGVNGISGTYTPVASSLSANLNSVTFDNCFYTRIGNIVTVTGYAEVDENATGTGTFEFDLPFDKTVSGADTLRGTVSPATEIDEALLRGGLTDTTKGRAQIEIGASSGAGVIGVSFSLMYQIA